MVTATKKKKQKLSYAARGNRVVVRLINESVSKGGIIIPETAQHRPNEAEILAVGPGKRLADGTLIPMDLEVGDNVIIVKYGGTELKIKGQDVLVLDADTEVLLMLNKE